MSHGTTVDAAIPQRILVTGAAGMVGQNLVPRLLSRNCRVVALDRNAATLAVLAARAPGVETRVADLGEPGSWTDLFAGCGAVVDLKAQITSPDRDEYLRNNVAATSLVVEACERHHVPHLVHASSSVVVSKGKDSYTETKRLGESLVTASTVPYTILRPSLMYGPGDIKHLGLILGLMEKLPILPLPGDGRYLRQPLYVGDFCSVIERALGMDPTHRAFNIIGHDRITFIDLLRKIREVRKLRCILLPTPMGAFRVALAMQRMLLRRPLFTTQQLDALTAGDDFPVEDWSGAFDVPVTSFASLAPEVYGSADGLRRALTEAAKRAR